MSIRVLVGHTAITLATVALLYESYLFKWSYTPLFLLSSLSLVLLLLLSIQLRPL